MNAETHQSRARHSEHNVTTRPPRAPDDATKSAQLQAEDVHRQAIMRLPTAVTPQTAAALQATENAWRRIQREYGALSSSEVSTLLGGEEEARSVFAARLRSSGQLIGVKRLGRYFHPGFQFDVETHRIKPVIGQLLRFAVSIGWDHHALVMWLATPTTYFEDERTPLDHLNDPNLLEVFEAAATIEW